MYKMTLNFPNLAKGAEVQIGGLGIFQNGYEYIIDDEEAEAYRVHNQVLETELDDDGNMTTTTVLGSTLLKAFTEGKKKDRPIVVETYTPEGNNDDNNNPPPPPADGSDDKNPEGEGN